MSQRNSEYARKPRDLYETPEWVTEAIIPHITPAARCVWEPACGNGAMARVFESHGIKVIRSDIATGQDFLHTTRKDFDLDVEAIVTNPPYGLAQDFIEHALALIGPNFGIVAMLLPTDFDSAVGRKHLFGDNWHFQKKIILTRRIVWFKRTDGKREAPSTNHCWMIWDWEHKDVPTIAYHYE